MKKTIITLVVIAAIAASVGGYYYTRPGPEPKISTAAVSKGDIIESVGATGTLDAVTSVNVGSQVSGIIKELGADFNSIVKKGQVILRIDPDAIQTQIEQSKANLTRAQADVERLKVSVDDARVKLKRTKELFAKNLVTQSDLDTADVNLKSAEAQMRSSQASLQQAQAQLNQQDVNLAHTVILAPIDGIVVQRAVDVGQTVQANFQSPTLFIIAADLTKMKCTANIDESDVGRIRPGQHVHFRVDAYANEEFGGTVVQVRLQPIVVQNVVTYGTVIEVPNPDLKLKPGMTANVQIEIAKKTDVVRVPNAAIRFRPTTDVFQALNQEVPPELLRGAGRLAGGPGATSGGPNQTTAGATGSGPAAQPGTNPARGQNARSAQPATAAAPLPTPSQAPVAGTPAHPIERGGGDRPQGADRPRGDGARGPGGGGGPMDPERRARFMERLQSMSPDERQQMLARMKERGMDVSAFQQAGATATPTAKKAADAAPMNTKGAQTIDSLFGPLPPRISSGRAWTWTAGTKQLKSVRLRLGITDGQYTELLEGELQPGQELVTGIVIGNESANRPGASNTSSPLMQQRGPMGRPGGGPH
ncbi:MAG TPA: efflux RND transporter periplasmic adaptor subunit [Vicinamibacterales bacterium]|jgi:HlyD family secretion protein